jgi:beta-fructofuranosidase
VLVHPHGQDGAVLPPVARPRLHFTPRSGWVNDPLGLTFRDGTYHLYFQHVPGQTDWAASCHWGHATSPDLLHWSERPVALAPSDDDAGCWSGSIATHDRATVLFYTSVNAPPDLAVGRIRTARPADPDLDVWTKDPGVAVELPAGVQVRTFRDPFVFEDAGRWWMLVGAGLADGTATALAWSSPDLDRWEYAGPLAERHRDVRDGGVWTGSMWECPQLVRVGDRHVLVVSVWDDGALHSVAAAVGRFADGRFDAESWHRMSWGDSHYAASAFSDREGRPGLVCWLRGVPAEPADWAGATSLPYRLGLDGDRPVLSLHPVLAEQRGPRRPTETLAVTWRPASSDALRFVDADGAAVVACVRTGERLSVSDGSGTALGYLPYGGGEVALVVDGAVLEIVGAAGVLAVPVPAGRGPLVPDGADEWWSLA